MTHPAIFIHNLFRPALLLVIPALLLAACGGESDDSPPPTVADLDALATSVAAAPIETSPTPAPPTPTTTPTLPATDTPLPITVAAIDSPTPAATDVPPTGTAAPDFQATDIALTTTAIAGAWPLTQTAAVVQTAQAPTVTPTPQATEPPPQPGGPFQIVFYSDRNGSDDIYLMTLDGVERAVASGLADEREPSCAPDGRTVVYASNESGRFQIMQLRLDGSAPVQLTDSEGMNFAPVYSPDGSAIAFVSTRNQGIPTIWLMDADGGNQRQITTELGRDTSPSWGPDGRQLLFASDQDGPWNLFITVLTEDVPGEFPVLPPDFAAGNQVWPVFDSLGERIAYTTWDDLTNPQTADIFLLDFELPEPFPLLAGPGAAIAWAWGDDSHLLASVGPEGDVQIALVDVTTGEAVRLTDRGSFNGGARLCTVDPAILPPEPTPAPTLTPSPTPTAPPPTATPTASPTPSTNTSALSPDLLAAQGRPHTVQPGENLLAISSTYGVSWTLLAEINRLSDPNRLRIGQVLTVPVTRTGHRPGGYQHPDPASQTDTGIRKQIVVRLDEQKVYAYEGDRLVRSVTVSTGLPDTPTVEGEFRIYQKLLSQTMRGPGYYLPGVPYVMYFHQGYGLHGTYWHDNFGQPMSHGCVNLPTQEAKWFYYWAEVGTPVRVLSSPELETRRSMSGEAAPARAHTG